MTTKILVGDCLDRLKELPDESVHCVVTSPPYWGLRSYQGDPGMIGLEQNFEEHLSNLVAVFREVRRVLRQDGTLWLNYGDAYARGDNRGGSGSGDKQASNAGSAGVVPRNVSGLKPKDLMMMPARVAMALQSCGSADLKAMQVIDRVRYELRDFYLESNETIPDRFLAMLERLDSEYAEAKGDSWWVRSEIIWHKPNPMPESVTDRPTSAHEKMFLLSKSAKYFYDAEAVRVTSLWGTNAVGVAGERNDVRASIPSSERVVPTTGANLRNVWKIPTQGVSAAHFATFPEKLVEPCILAGTSEKGCCAECGAPLVRQVDVSHENPGNRTTNGPRSEAQRHETAGFSQRLEKRSTTTGWSPTCAHNTEPIPCIILDPFAGSGTVGLVAQGLGRSSVLIEISKEYAEMARDRIAKDRPLFSQVEMDHQPEG